MPLPKLSLPIFELEVPSTGAKVKFHPFTVRDEKILLMAKVSEEQADILQAVKQVVNNCCIEEMNVDALTIFDVEYLFLKLRSNSVNNIIKVSYEDAQDGKLYDFAIDLKNVRVSGLDGVPESKIDLGNEIGMQLRYPSAAIYGDPDFLKLPEEEMLFELCKSCIDVVWEGDSVYPASEQTPEDLSQFLSGLDVRAFEKVQAFLEKSPKLHYKIEYKNSLGNERSITLSTLSDFFSLR